MTRDEVDAFLQRREHAWLERNAAGVAADYAESCVVESPTHGTISGRDAIRSVYATWFDAFPDLKFVHDEFLVDGDRVALFFTSSGTNLKPFGSIPASGRNMVLRGVFLMTFRDGQIVHEKRYYDSTSLLVQIGAIKAKPV
jgi:steroid delta-isomerase-like uncharacterized protein